MLTVTGDIKDCDDDNDEGDEDDDANDDNDNNDDLNAEDLYVLLSSCLLDPPSLFPKFTMIPT